MDLGNTILADGNITSVLISIAPTTSGPYVINNTILFNKADYPYSSLVKLTVRGQTPGNKIFIHNQL